MTSVLVTGAAGFIGTHLVPLLRQSGDEVVEVDAQSGDVAEESTWSSFPSAEVVVHLAGKSFVPDSWLDPSEFIRCNLVGTIGALDYSRRRNARLVFVSSYLYGNPQDLPVPESTPTIATNPYALSKKLAEDACSFYSTHFGVQVAILRPFNVYGPGQPSEFLIPSIVRQIKQGGPIRVKDLEPKRDYVYIADVVRFIKTAFECKERFSVFNIGTGVSHSVGELIDIVQEEWHTRLAVVSEEKRRKDEILDTVADITQAKLRLGWSPEWTLRQGIAAMRRISDELSERHGRPISSSPGFHTL